MSAYRRIGGPNAITVWSYSLSLVVLLVVTTIPSERDQFIGSLGQRLLLATVGTSAGFVVLALAWLTVLRPGARASRPLTALGVFGVAGAVQGITIVFLRQEVGLPPVGSVTLVVTRAIAGVVWLAFIAIVVDQLRLHERRVAELQARIGEMEDARVREQHDLGGEVERLRAETLAPVRRALDQIASRLAMMDGGGRAEEQAEALRLLVNDQVRPLSHALLGEMPTDLDVQTAASLPTRRERLGTVLRLSVTAMASPALLAIALPMTLILLFAVQEIGPVFLVVASVSYLVVVGGLFLLARRMLDPLLPRMRTAAALAVVLVAYELLAVAAVVNGWAWGGLSEIGRWVEWPALITLPLVWLALSTVRASERQGEAVEEQLEDVLDQLTVVSARRRQRVRHERQVLGRLLHGSTQAGLLSIASRLEQSADDEDPGPAIEAAATELQSLRQRLMGPAGETWEVSQALDDLVTLWSGVVDVDLQVAHEVLALLDRAPATRSSVLDVVAEGLTNAVRHGRAHRVVIRIAVESPGLVSIVVSDDGRGAPSVVPGMGSEMLDEVAHDWHLSVTPAGSVLTASVVVDPSVAVA